ncbi:MAG: hypothetical protein M1840_001017 [Geoglossum simile]|nr:MAG: hypothetical protein M1840_001017 [Geoglossum simile]
MAPPRKRRRDSNAAEEVVFDLSARADYLTGFHKRKLQRIKHAQEEAAKREKAERIAVRKRLREQRKEELKNHVEAVNALLREQADHQSPDEGGSDGDDGSEEEEWAGFDDPLVNKPVPIDYEDQYVDEDRYTTVTIESVDITKSGLHKSASAEAGSEDGSSVSGDAAAAQEEGRRVERKEADGKRLSAKKRPLSKLKVKKKFRYLSKGDRKATRMKERSGNRAKAKARRA